MIKLEFDANDTVLMKHLGQALHDAALELNGELVTPKEEAPSALHMQRMRQIDAAHVPTDEGLEDESKILSTLEPLRVVESSDTIDANGFPWDARIHSSSKKRNNNNTWKMVRGLDDDLRVEVEAELKALMAIPVKTVTSYPVYWRHDGTDEVGIIRNDEEYAQVFDSTSEIIDQISEELFNELRLKNTNEVDFEDTQPKFTEEETEELAAQGAHVPEAEVVAGNIPKPEATNQSAPPPPPPVVEAPVTVGNTPDDVEVVDVKTITRYITGVVIKEKGYAVPDINKMLTDQYGLAFATLATRPELLPQIYKMLQGLPSK